LTAGKNSYGDADGAGGGWACSLSQVRYPGTVSGLIFFTILNSPGACLTLSYMKTSALTIRLDPELNRQLDRLAKRSGRSRSEIARDALRRQLAVLQLDEARKQILPFAEARGYLTDEDVFREIS
jgi:predicted transcriptional regulator